MLQAADLGRLPPTNQAACACRWLAQLLANVGLKHPDPMFAEITEPTQPLPLPPPE